MIIDNNKRSSFKSRLPFSATFNKHAMTVSFSEGNVFDCYNYSSNPNDGYKNGSRFSKVIGQEFSVVNGDQFFINSDVEGARIYKVSKAQRDSGFSHSGVLIWRAPTEDEGEEQAYSENIFLQDYESNRDLGFGIKKIKEEGEQITYKINSGFVFCPQLGYSKFIQGYEFVKSVLDEAPSFRLKVSVSASLSNTDTIGDANIYFINGLTVNDVVLEESNDDTEEIIKLANSGDILNGIYYVDLAGTGTVNLFFTDMTEEFAFINPGQQTQVRGAKYYKNGISVDFRTDEEPDASYGYYKEVIQTRNYDKYLITYEDIGGEIFSSVEKIGVWTSTTTSSVEGSSYISEEPPTINVINSDDGEIGEDEFLIFIDQENSTSGQEISDAALNQCRSESRSLTWTDIEIWEGDGTPVTQGAGFNGEDKASQFVTYAERRFKSAAFPSVISDNLPQSYIWYGRVIYDDATEIPITTPIPFKQDLGVYASSSFYEISHSSTEGVFGKNDTLLDCEAQALGGYADINITKVAYDYYQSVQMTYSQDSII